MMRTQPLLTPEELQCLLGAAPVQAQRPTAVWRCPRKFLHFGAALWLVKGVFLYAVLTSPQATHLLGSGLYLGMRGTLELACLMVFGLAAMHPHGRSLASASMLVACTSLVMDAMTVLSVTA
ncbi:hypothetical protein [Limnohabitans sp.]|jgi:hypothetical protein|uniref:hypothetical protein n=1 Tax=Limnohabitans sp. TaxID=1907725 RepID=UPI0037BEC80C